MKNKRKIKPECFPDPSLPGIYRIILNTGEVCLIDEKFKHLGEQQVWTAKRTRSITHAYRKFYPKGRQAPGKSLYLHRLIFEEEYGPLTSEDILDHINQNGVDNRLSNLRKGNKSKNALNRGKQSNNTSGYRNIMWNKDVQKWHVSFVIRKKKYFVGNFKTIEEAKAKRDQALEKAKMIDPFVYIPTNE
jgi:hypothetical protein